MLFNTENPIHTHLFMEVQKYRNINEILSKQLTNRYKSNHFSNKNNHIETDILLHGDADKFTSRGKFIYITRKIYLPPDKNLEFCR